MKNKKSLVNLRVINSIITCLICTLSLLNADAQRVLFKEDFGQPNGRVTNPNVPSKGDAFVFGDPNLVYPLPKPAAINWTNSDLEYQMAAKAIENNHYAIVAPNQIYSSVQTWDNSTKAPNIWYTWSDKHNDNKTTIIKADAPADNNMNNSGKANGGMFLVNAGTTKGIIYNIPVVLTKGKYYSLEYAVFSQNGNIKIRTNFKNSTNNATLYHKDFTSGQDRKWKVVKEYFYIEPKSCLEDKFKLTLQNWEQNNYGNDFAIDNIILKEITNASEINKIKNKVNAFSPPCSYDQKIPVANDNLIKNENPESKQILLNDFYKGIAPQAWQITFAFIVPSGGSLSPHNSNELNIPREGKWNYQNGIIQFTRETSFIGNPTPIQYTISADGFTSSPAYIYIETNGTPQANNDETTVPADYTTANVAILANDLASNTTQEGANTSNVQVELRHPDTNLPSGNEIVVIGEGTWIYNSETGAISFTPEPGFTPAPTPLTYTIIHPINGRSSATVTIEVMPITPGTLPVEIASFYATTQEGYSTLNWSTTEEINSQKFEVQRSTNGIDWDIIGHVATRGEGEGKNLYSFNDPTRVSGLTYYRLRTIDLDGSFEFSSIVSIKAKSTLELVLYPNPASDIIILKDIYVDHIAEVKIINSYGITTYAAANYSHSGINVSQLDKGTYIVMVKLTDGSVNTRKIAIIR